MFNLHWPAKTRSVVLIVIFVFVVGAVAGSWTTVRAGRLPFTPRPASLNASSTARAEVSFANGFAPVAKAVLPAVVNIASSKTVHSSDSGTVSPFSNDPFFRQFFGDEFSKQLRVPRDQRERSLGSGVIVKPAGYILTNNHVVDGATNIKVTLSDNREFTAKVVGTDPRADVAVLKIDANDLPVLALGDSSKMEVGDFVLAVGNPFGVGRTMTMGIISATGRGNLGIEDYEDFIQTDAAINPGNSGGALVNVQGELIGINTAIVTAGGSGNQGVGFAVPINMARQEMEQIFKHGKVIRGWLGVEAQPVTPEIAKAFGIRDSRGALVSDATPNGPAAKGGIERGDVIVGLRGIQVEDGRQLSLRISQTDPGTRVKLELLRDGKPREIAVTLGELPAKQETAVSACSGSGPRLGMAVETVTPELARQLALPSGIVGAAVSDVESGSAAEKAGVQKRDVIQQVNRKAIASANEFVTSVQAAGNQPVLLLIDRGGNHLYLVVTPH
jgi:serine protease Do